MSVNKIIVGLLTVSLVICVGFANNAYAWGEDTPYGSGEAWFMDMGYCDPDFTVAIANFNHTYPNAFNYTLTYTLQYRDADNIVQDESISVESFNITLPDNKYIYQSHSINLNTMMNILSEVEEDTVNPYRVVKVELDYEYCDAGGCGQSSGIDKWIDFTNCDPVTGTGYGEPLTPDPTTDYGFDLEGRGSDGGSGSIYEGIDLYGGTGDESGMGAGFGWIFYGLIPIIFMFSVFKFCRRVLWGEN
jgi:hypothetical protein